MSVILGESHNKAARDEINAKNVLAGIELMHMIRKGKLMMEVGNERSFADQFYALAGQIRPV